ncbi:MAG: peptidoglycan editing factor PgeF [Bacillota bacterium]
MFSLIEDNDLKYFVISKFKDFGFNAYFSTRQGGYSTGKYNSLNLGLHTTDNLDNVRKNRKKLAKSIGVNPVEFVAAEQIHGYGIYDVDKNDIGAGALKYKESIPGVDALITSERNIPLISFYADCVPLMLIDMEKKIISLAHAGWKGTVKKIGKKTVTYMNEKYNSDINDIYIAIGPSISRDFYEVDSYIINQFESKYRHYKDFIVSKGKDRYMLDLWEANIHSLKEAGISEQNIIMSNLCTFKNKGLFYSYRREKGKTGRMASIIYMK